PLPVWHLVDGRLAVLPAGFPASTDDDDEDLLDLSPAAFDPAADPTPWPELLSDAVFGADDGAPRFVLLIGLDEWLLLDRYKWPNNRALRFSWSDILDRRDARTLRAAAALLHKDSLAPADGSGALLERLDENAHRHAFGVSASLKYALREAIELLGNEAARRLDELATNSKRSIYSGASQLDPAQLSLECLRMVYRLLFLFYIEARPELGYVPIQKSELYLKGYSLESLRELELQPLLTEQARNGTFFDASLRRLFSLVAEGYDGAGHGAQIALHDARPASVDARDSFALAALDSRLFDDDAMPLLNKVRFPNHVWQRVIELLSLSKKDGARRRGRVSYQLLSINQLGAVYEALLSYRGFFAAEDLYEVQPAPKAKANATAENDDDEVEHDDGDDSDSATDSGAVSGAGATSDVLDSAWFVPAARLDEFTEAERVYDRDDHGRRTLRKYPRGSFIYRLAGRDRQKSASYYTPQVLTQCLVQYALQELFAGGRVRSADDILSLTVCEPAMGSAAFLNEAVNQLAETYLERKQAELGRRIPHDEYAAELQKVRMYLADRNVFGVDLNPVAVELAEVSLWLNAIYGEQDADGAPLPARVPWFGYQLFAGNSLIGARRQVYPAAALRKGGAAKKSAPAWFEQEPRTVTADAPRRDDEIWHFLLPDGAMAAYADKVAKTLYPADFKRLSEWRRQFTRPLEPHEIARLQDLSAQVDALWDQHTKNLVNDRGRTEDPLTVWGQPAPTDGADRGITRADKERIRREGLFNEDGDLATPFRRLKLVMDYWCALWFWPLTRSEQLPSREQWWLEAGAILEGNVVDVTAQAMMTFAGEQAAAPSEQATLLAADETAPAAPRLHDRFGQLRISRLREHFPRIAEVEGVAEARRFLHWPLHFADVLLARGGFDMVLGNPPWLKIEWNEAGVLGERNPLFAIRKFSAAELARLRADAFEHFPGLQAAWTTELEEAEGAQNFLNAAQNYPLLKGMHTNLYKCFLPVAWGLNSARGVAALLHPEGVYDDPKGGAFRQALYPRLRRHFQFINELQLFADVHHNTKFGINVYSSDAGHVAFETIANLFTPATVDACYTHDGDGEVGGYKNAQGKWNLAGHRDRIVRVDDAALAIFAQLYDEPGTPARRARLPALHAGALNTVLGKLARYPRRLADLGEAYFSTMMWNETTQQHDGTISRRPLSDAGFPRAPEDWVLSGPHFFVANPYNKTPHRVCSSNKAYDVLDLERLPDDYLPRTNYRPMADRAEYLRRTPRVSWVEPGESEPRPVTEYFRHVNRLLVGPASERTACPSILPPHAGHIDGVFSITFRHDTDLLRFSTGMSSLLVDFVVKSTGKNHVRGDVADMLPLIDLDVRALSRYLCCICLTSH
ncbi:MAG: class I SAM-dependent DNA methyltransferase, partial [Chloroflexi bacterium]|nr:class I SAM-dependent DNA methyltransferase [Chloroflexota bacterium]